MGEVATLPKGPLLYVVQCCIDIDVYRLNLNAASNLLLRCNYSSNVLKLLVDISVIVRNFLQKLSPLLNCSGIAQKLHWNCTETALKQML